MEDVPDTKIRVADSIEKWLAQLGLGKHSAIYSECQINDAGDRLAGSTIRSGKPPALR